MAEKTKATGIRIVDRELKRKFFEKLARDEVKMNPVVVGWIREYVDGGRDLPGDAPNVPRNEGVTVVDSGLPGTGANDKVRTVPETLAEILATATRIERKLNGLAKPDRRDQALGKRLRRVKARTDIALAKPTAGRPRRIGVSLRGLAPRWRGGYKRFRRDSRNRTGIGFMWYCPRIKSKSPRVGNSEAFAPRCVDEQSTGALSIYG